MRRIGARERRARLPAADWRWAGAAAVVVGMALVGCSSREAGEKEPVVTVEAAVVKRGTLQRIVTADAVLFPLHQASIVPKVSAPVSQFYVNRGDRVERGQLLALLENKDLAAAVAESRGAYEQAEAAYETATKASVPEEVQKAELDVKAAKEALDAAQKRYDSLQNLYRQGAAARKDVNDAGVALTQARNAYEIAEKHLTTLQLVRADSLKVAEGQLAAARARYEGAQAQLNYSKIRSPIEGVVTDRPLYPGEMATAGAPLITVMDTSRVVARAHLPQSEAQLLKLGDRATLSVPGVIDELSGTVTMVSPALDPGSTTVEVWVEVPNPHRALKPGTSARLSMVAETVTSALMIPAPALLTAADGSTTVMLAGADGRAHQQSVKTGIRQNDLIQITDGLKEGDQVVTSGAYGLADNTKIKIAAPPPESAAKQGAGGKE